MAIESIPSLRSWEKAKEFLYELRPKLIKLPAREQGYYIGSGAYGYAFGFRNTDTVLKVTTDDIEIELAKFRKGMKTHALVTILDVESVKSKKGNSLGLIVVPHLKPGRLTVEERKRISLISGLIDDFNSIEDFILEVKKHNSAGRIPSRILDLLRRLVRDYKADTIKDMEYLDVHVDNILQDADGNLILIDN